MNRLSLDFLSDKKILVTGGYGFVGRALVKKLTELGMQKIEIVSHDGQNIENTVKCPNGISDNAKAGVYIFRSSFCDLRKKIHCKLLLNILKPHIVIHLAANVGGIGKNMLQPATLFYDNLLIGSNTFHESYISGVEKFVNLSSICAYPKYTPTPFREEYFWEGYPEETNAPYGLAKKMLILQGEAYLKQYGFKSVHLLCANLYGEGDHFDPETSHVIPALIKKVIDAKTSNKNSIEIWGTGNEEI